jgi:signal transduction histidine kinase
MQWRDPRVLLRPLLLGLVYFAAGRLGLSFSPVSGVASAVWPPTGIALAALLVMGRPYWPAIFLAATAVNWSVGVPPWAAIVIGAGNTLEAVIGVALLRSRGFQNKFDELRHVLSFTALAAFIATSVSASFGVLSLFLQGHRAGLWDVWRVWWLGDAMGALLVGAPLLVWTQRESWQLRLPRVLEASGLTLVQVAIGAFVFHGRDIHFSYLLFPPLIAGSVRFGQRGAVTGAFAVEALAIVFTSRGQGPFIGGSATDNLVLLQTFMAVLSMTLLTLGAAVEERARAIHMREEILAIVSHDLKNPLATILIRAQQLTRRSAPPDGGANWGREARVIEEAAVRMRRLIDDLIDFAAISGGGLRVQREPHEASHLIDDALQILEPLAGRKKISLANGSQPLAHEVSCDRDRVFEVFFNLVGNAIAATPEGGAIVLRAQETGPEIMFSVADTGPGIAPDHLRRVFDRYWRAGKNDRRNLGLGLAIARGIVEAHGGRIWAESPPGAGATFSFTLPMAKARSATSVAPSEVSSRA